MQQKDYGNYIWRGGEKIELEREEEVFTAVVRNEEELQRVETVAGVKRVRGVDNRVYRMEVDKDARDGAMERIRSDELKGICHHAYRPRGSQNTRYYLTDQIIVQFKPELTEEEIAGILASKSLRILKEYEGQDNTFLLQVTETTGENPVKAANRLVDEGKVVYAEPNLVNRFVPFYEPSDTYFPYQWHLKSWSGVELVEDADVSAAQAWDITLGAREVVAAVVDDGFDLTHPDFAGEGKVVSPKDYVDGDAHPFPESAAGDYHGTPCAGVAIAEENGQGVVGIAPRCAFMPVRFPFDASDSFLAEIFEYVGRRANVISCSWGPPPAYAPIAQILKDKLHELATSGGPQGKGCVIVFAAGNYNAPLYDPNNYIVNGLAIHPDVMAVAASTSLNEKAAYSNWGEEISVCAPSDNSHPTLDIYVPGRGIWTTDNEQYGHGFTAGSRYTGRFGGTSSATPLVAGIAALVISANPELTALEVKNIIQSTADDISDPNAPPHWRGHGKVNAYEAVKEADRRRGIPTMVNRSVSPHLRIPDRTPSGVDSVLSITEEGIIEDIKISVDISHTYIGDLIVRLAAPSGQSAILHNRSGAGANDIVGAYDAGTLAALQAFIGEEVHGDWTLTVEDHAYWDTGTLSSWELEASLKQAETVCYETSPGMQIPDNKPAGIDSDLDVPAGGQVKELKVSLDITHTWIGDLEVSLASPSGISVTIHNQVGGSKDNIIRTFDTTSTPDLQMLVGAAIQGTWTLHVADHVGQDVGKLNRWALEITRE